MKQPGRIAYRKDKRKISKRLATSNVFQRDALANVADIVELLKRKDLSEGLTPSARAGLFCIYGLLIDAIKHVSNDLAATQKAVLSDAPRPQARRAPAAAPAPPATAGIAPASGEIVNALVFSVSPSPDLAARFKDAAMTAFTVNGWTSAGSDATRVTAQQQGRDLLRAEIRLVGDTVLIGYHRGLHSNSSQALKALQATLEAELQRPARKSP